VDYLKALISDFGAVEWLIVGAIAFLAAGTAPVKSLAAKAWSMVPALNLPSPSPVSEPETVTELIEKLEARRAGLAAEIARIDQLLGVKP